MSVETAPRDPTDPRRAHPADLLGERVRVDFGSRTDTGEVLQVSDDHLRGRKIRIRFRRDGGSRNVSVDPGRVDVELVGGEPA